MGIQEKSGIQSGSPILTDILAVIPDAVIQIFPLSRILMLNAEIINGLYFLLV